MEFQQNKFQSYLAECSGRIFNKIQNHYEHKNPTSASERESANLRHRRCSLLRLVCRNSECGVEATLQAAPGFSVLASTGVAFEVPEGYAMLVFSRSGHGFKNQTRLANCVGVIDSDYRGEVMVKLVTESYDECGGDDLWISPGDRIAQAMLVPVPRCDFEVVEQLTLTERGTCGFGSTGA